MPKRILTGKVTSNKSDKTITVLVERKIMHPMYKKFVTKSKKFSAHDDQNKFNIGDIVNANTTDRTDGFQLSTNGSTVLLFSLTGDAIDPGAGPVMTLDVLPNGNGEAQACINDLVISEIFYHFPLFYPVLTIQKSKNYAFELID